MLPCMTLGNTKISRLIAGGNPFIGKSCRSAELDGEMRAYFTRERILETLRRCEECGVNTVVLEDSMHTAELIRQHRTQGGGMNWIALISGGVCAEACLQEDCRPAAVCLHSSETDRLYLAGDYAELQRRLDAIRALGIPAGLATCLPEVIERAGELGLNADFYMGGLFNISRSGGDEYTAFYDELDAFYMLRAMRQTPKPCIAFKVLGAGRRCRSPYHTRLCIQDAFEGIKRTDAVVVGLYPAKEDQVGQDAECAAEAIREIEFSPYRGECDGLGKKTEYVPGGIPAYWEEAVEKAAEKYRRNQAKSDRVSSLVFITDMHWEQNNGNAVPVINALKRKTGLRRVIFGGDLMVGHVCLETAARTAARWVEHMNGLGADGWYAVRGNHDNNGCRGIRSGTAVWTDDDYYDNVLMHARNADRTGQKRLYGYEDDCGEKIRYYFLDNHSHGSTPPDPAAINRVSFSEQLAWLKQTARELDPEWGILVVQHMGFTEENVEDDAVFSEEERRYFPVIDGRGAPCFDEAGHFTGPYLADFRTKQRGACEPYLMELMEVLDEMAADEHMPGVIAVLTGHTHWDASLRAAGGYPVIATSCDAGAGSSQSFDRLCPDRTPGTDTEQLMDIVQIDRANRRLYLTRVGGGIDREFAF